MSKTLFNIKDLFSNAAAIIDPLFNINYIPSMTAFIYVIPITLR